MAQGFDGTHDSLQRARKQLSLRYHPDRSDFDRSWFQELYRLTGNLTTFNIASGVDVFSVKETPVKSKDTIYKKGKDSLDIVGKKMLKKFCRTPIMKPDKGGGIRVKCGHCVLHGLLSNLITFAKEAVMAHNSYRFFDEVNDDDSEPFDPFYVHDKIQRSQSALEDLGLGVLADQNDEGLYDLEEVTDDIAFDDLMTISEITEVFKEYGIPTTVRSKVFFSRGKGIAMHLKKTGHYVDLGKQE